VIEQISSKYVVAGVTSVDDELFALLRRDHNQVAVYSINDYQLLRHIHLPGLKRLSAKDITSCVRHNCLYASDQDNYCIHRYDMSIKVGVIMRWVRSRHINQWSVPGKPGRLSVTPGSCNLLVTIDYPTNKLVEMCADSGQSVREIALQSDITSLHHAVQLTTGQYVVCHGAEYDRLNRVCLVDVEGRVTRSYGGQRGRGVGQLNLPCHLAVDEDSQFIFVASWHNHKVMIFSPTLEFVREFSVGVADPSRLYFHQTTRRLFVGQWDGVGVTVIQL